MGATAKTVDMSGVKERGNFSPKQVAEGDYAAKVTKVEDTKTKDTEEFMYLFTIKLDKFSQNSYPYYCKLTENQLWKLRNIMVAGGINVPKKRMKLDPNKVVGKSVGVTMEDDEHEGKMKSQIAAIFPIAELADGPEIEDADDDEAFDADSAVPATDDVDDDEGEAEAEEKPKKKKDKGGKKKSKKKKDEEGELEELDISDV